MEILRYTLTTTIVQEVEILEDDALNATAAEIGEALERCDPGARRHSHPTLSVNGIFVPVFVRSLDVTRVANRRPTSNMRVG